MQFKRKQFHDGIASQQRQALFKKIRISQLYSNKGQAQSDSQEVPDQLISIAEVPRRILVQPREDSNLNGNIQPPSGDFQNKLSQPYEMSYRSDQPIERMVSELQQDFNDISFASQPNQTLFQVGFP